MEEKPHKIQDIMRSTMNELKTMIDANTVIGTPIDIDEGTRIIPISKVIVGLVAGGGEYSENNLTKQKKEDYPFAVGSGTGFQIIPVGFLLKEEGRYKLLEIENAQANNLIELVAKTIKNLTDKGEDKNEEEQ